MSTLNIGINHSGSAESGTITDKRSVKKERLAKSDSAFRTISEVADEINVAQHVLRFWESKFMQIEPLKRGGGRRYYRPEDVELIKKIHNLLYNQGFTIRGVQKLLKGDKRLDGLSVNTSMSALVAEEKAVANTSFSPAPVSGRTQGQNLFSASAQGRGMDDTTRKAFKILLEDLKGLRSLIKQQAN